MSAPTPSTPSELESNTVAFPKDQNLFSFLFSNPFQHVPNRHAREFPDHTFDGLPIPIHRPSIVHSGTGAQLSWIRLKHDSLRIARGLSAIVGAPLPYKPSAASSIGAAGLVEPIHSPRTTVLLHIPNCLAWPLLALGTLAANYTVCPVSTYLTPRELSHILAKARPQVLITSTGPDGEGVLRKALQILIDGEAAGKDNGKVKGDVIQRWAIELATDWDSGKRVRKERSESLPIAQRRIWTVDLVGATDYYGTSLSNQGVAASIDPRDWTNLLVTPPSAHQAAGSSEEEALAFHVSGMEEDEQRRRVAFLLWSSGTTGTSKGVLLSHRAFVSNTMGSWDYNAQYSGPSRGAYGGGERWAALAPWCHVYGLATLLLPTIATGATLVLPASPAFKLASYLQLLTRYKVTWAHIAPAVAVALRSSPLLDPSHPSSKGIDLSSVKGYVTGGAPVPVEVIKQVYQRTGKYIQLAYGTTETISTANCYGTQLDRDVNGPRDELGSAGDICCNNRIRIAPVPGTTREEVKARGDEVRRVAREARSRGERGPKDPCDAGEILIKGPTLMLGYFSGLASSSAEEGGSSSALDLELTTGAFSSDGQGWYRSGDEGVLDANGRLWITGRTKELIKVKGFQVPPAELDSLLAQHPKVADAAATGVTDESDGSESVLMLIVPSDKEILSKPEAMRSLADELSKWVSGQTAYYKWPSAYLFSETSPRNPTGKILRKNVATTPGTKLQALKIGRVASKL
ncbi:acetyl-CoA synthetase-like protein [Violaceomyces palustris]|uniref:Acetyl-CoA synthetase-like protein n=1 Tax=Violaceomyces palustris TaxID=1673888 RepID=A0ACD0P0N9_9BASI|nr:acetyl-CoA synthetase-like protein [Violaceomyces palustris]